MQQTSPQSPICFKNDPDSLYNGHGENLTKASTDRYVLYPIRHDGIWKFYKKAQASSWTCEEVDLTQDIAHWHDSLSDDERAFIVRVLAFFAASDGIVVENLVTRFCSEITIPEVRCFYTVQAHIENVHSEMYSLLLDTYISDPIEKALHFDAMSHCDAITRKGEWALRWIENGSFQERLVAFACVEGIFFSASFCAIFWLKKRGIMPGLTFSNELISRDEGLHRDFACLLHRMLDASLPDATVSEIVKEAVDLELAFVHDALPVHLIGMNATLMCEYVQFVGDHLLSSLGTEKLYKTNNPFDFMELISLEGKTNFFEKRVGEYAKANVGGKYEERVFSLDEDF